MAEPQRVSTRATGVVGIAVMCSRVLGLIREQVFAGLFGAGKNLDAFLMAFRLPTTTRDAIQRAAQDEQRSASNLVLRVVSEWLVEHGYLQQRSKKK